MGLDARVRGGHHLGACLVHARAKGAAPDGQAGRIQLLDACSISQANGPKYTWVLLREQRWIKPVGSAERQADVDVIQKIILPPIKKSFESDGAVFTI